MLDIKCASFGTMENNCYLVTDRDTGKSALIDCTEDSPQMSDFIKDADLEYILLTHGHFDHIAGCKAVKEKTDAKLAIHGADESMLTSARDSLALFCYAEQNDVNADIILSDGDVITLGNSEIKVISTPGHTYGSVCFLADRALFTGDTLFNMSLGRTDFPTGSPRDMIKSLKRIDALEGDYDIYPGHESISTLDYQRAHNVDFQILIGMQD
jgi:glyoxylase-like metal-dependent hydrolase (beta-lactamase superfamily II)